MTTKDTLYPFILDHMSTVFHDIVEDSYMAGGLGESQYTEIAEDAVTALEGDLLTYVDKDPAAGKSTDTIKESYKTFFAITSYRIAHAIHNIGMEEQEYLGSPSNLVVLARQISEHAKAKTGVEIHPAAKIGKNFVLDHGIGTIIGETCSIGDNCMILNNVVLGASGVAYNKDVETLGYRHPQIGDRVEIAGNADVLGPITIGDDSFIGARVQVTDSVPPATRITNVAMLQIERPSVKGPQRPRVHGVIHSNEGMIEVFGEHLATCNACWSPVWHSHTEEVPDVSVDIELCVSRYGLLDKLELKLRVSKELELTNNKSFCRIALSFDEDDNGRILLGGLPVEQAFRTAELRT